MRLLSEQLWRDELSAELDICIPFLKDDPVALIDELSQQTGAVRHRLSLCDDGSCQPELTARVVTALERYPGPAALFTLSRNTGRANARNVALRKTHCDWVLLLDADMSLDRRDFIENYKQAARRFDQPCCIVGGFRVDMSDVHPQTLLHAAQSLKSECRPAAERALDPGKHVYSSSIFVHRSILARHLFDPEFQAWGWEDVEWGWRVVKDYPIYHIDNPARHRGLDEDRVLIVKYAESGGNFHRIKQLYPTQVARMPIARVAQTLSWLPFQENLSALFKRTAMFERLPVMVRLYALKLYRASRYSWVYHDR